MKIEYSHVDESTTNNIEHMRTKEPIGHTLNLAPKEIITGNAKLLDIIDRIAAVGDSMSALAEELRRTMREEHMDPSKGKEHCMALHLALFKLDPGEYLVITTKNGGRIVVQWREGPDLDRFFEVTASGFRYRFKTISLDNDDTILCGTEEFRIVLAECEEWFRTWDPRDAMEGDA